MIFEDGCRQYFIVHLFLREPVVLELVNAEMMHRGFDDDDGPVDDEAEVDSAETHQVA